MVGISEQNPDRDDTSEPDADGSAPQSVLDGARQMASSGQGEPDVLLDVPALDVDEINLEGENLRAKVSLQAEVLDLVKLNVGADVDLGRVALGIKGMQAEALLKVRLDQVASILGRVLTTVERNPEIVTRLTRGGGEATQEIGAGAGDAASEVGESASEAGKEVGSGEGDAISDVDEGAGGAVQDVDEGAERAVGDVRERAGREAGDANSTGGSVADEAREAAAAAGETVRKTARKATEAASEATHTARRTAERVSHRPHRGKHGHSRRRSEEWEQRRSQDDQS